MHPSLTLPRPPLLTLIPSRKLTVLAWTSAIASPVLLAFALINARGGFSAPRVLLPVLVGLLPFGLLRRRPLIGLSIMLVGSAAVSLMMETADAYFQLLVVDLAVGYIAATRRRWVSATAAVMAFLVQDVSAAYHTVGVMSFAVIALLAVITTWLVGNSIRQRNRYAEALRAKAVTAERLRIARELHDMVAHSIGIIAIQAGVGGRVIDTQPDEARKALATIEATSRQTLAGLRRTLVSLRRPDQDAAADPDPGLADIEQLAAATLAAGVRVDVRWRGQRRSVPAEIDLSAFRIVQESLTNVVRHAGTGECRVVVDFRDDDLLIAVADDGCGGTDDGYGYGIRGMRERVGLLDGDFSAGPRPEGGFLVTARLPALAVA